MEKNQEFELLITDIDENGAGIGKTFDTCSSEENSHGFPWFVKDAVPGDRIIAAATKVKNNYGFARIVRILSPSAFRTDPRCEIAARCGGCQLQQIDYSSQLQFKEKKVYDALIHIGKFPKESFTSDIVTEPIIGMDYPWHYRNKSQYPVGINASGTLSAGFYAAHSHRVIECRECLIGSKEDPKILENILSFMKQQKISAYDEESGKGTVRHILLRTSRHTGEIMVCLVINSDRLKNEEQLCRELLALYPQAEAPMPHIGTICVSVNKQNTNVILGEQIRTLYGPGYITDTIGGISFSISPLSFFQINPVQVEKLYGKALEYAGVTGSETVWDLYCGVGTISLFFAHHVRKVYGVEVIPQAVENAKENAVKNGISNAEFFVGKAEDIITDWMSDSSPETENTGMLRHPDIICVDPPRKGCDDKCLETILKASPEKIVYVSCNPSTLARDLRFLCDHGYFLRKVCPVDMFPHTVHVETVVLMSRVEE